MIYEVINVIIITQRTVPCVLGKKSKLEGVPVNIKIQKVIMFIPIVNFFLIFVWLKYISNNNLGSRYFVKVGLKIILMVAIVSIIFGLLDSLVKNIFFSGFISWMEIYITLFLISFIVVKEQEKP